MFNVDKLHFFLKKQFFSEMIEVHIGKASSQQNKWDVAHCLLFTAMPEGAAYVEPTFTLSNKDAQQLMDNLWDCGIRPSEGTGSAGSLAATQKHLEDMRRIVFSDAYKPLK